VREVLPTHFGDRLRTLRRDAGLSQSELAGKDLSASYISLLESGKRTASSEVLHELAARLGCSAQLLIDGRQSDREQHIELELAYAKLAIEHAESGDAAQRLQRLLDDDEADTLPLRTGDQISDLLATACERLGDLDRSLALLVPLFERACADQPDLPTHLLVTDLGIRLTRIQTAAGDRISAVEVGRRALAAAKAQGLSATTDYFRLAATVFAAYVVRGDWTTATRLADQYLAEALQHGEVAGQAALLWNASLLAHRRGDTARARGMAERAMGLLSELDNARDYARLRVEVASMALSGESPNVTWAADLLQRCASDLKDLGTPVDLARWHVVDSQVLLCQGDPAGAEASARQALDLASSKAASPSDRVEALVALSDTLAAQCRDAEASTLLLSALRELQSQALTRLDAVDAAGVARRLAGIDPRAALTAYELTLGSVEVPDHTAAVRKHVDALRERPTVPAR
jgi:transcriptional regulator with XRE-family HTH domain